MALQLMHLSTHSSLMTLGHPAQCAWIRNLESPSSQHPHIFTLCPRSLFIVFSESVSATRSTFHLHSSVFLLEFGHPMVFLDELVEVGLDVILFQVGTLAVKHSKWGS